MNTWASSLWLCLTIVKNQHPSPLSDPILSSLTPKQPLERPFFLLPWYLRDKLRRSLKNLWITLSSMDTLSGCSLVFWIHWNSVSCWSKPPAGIRSSCSWSLSSETRGCSRSSSNNLDRLWKKGRVESGKGREEKEGFWELYFHISHTHTKFEDVFLSCQTAS